MKALVVAAALMMGSSMAMAHGRTCEGRNHRTHRSGSTAICQTVFSDAQNARAVCAANGLGWVKLTGQGATGYRCGCGSWDPSAPGSVQ